LLLPLLPPLLPALLPPLLPLSPWHGVLLDPSTKPNQCIKMFEIDSPSRWMPDRVTPELLLDLTTALLQLGAVPMEETTWGLVKGAIALFELYQPRRECLVMIEIMAMVLQR